MALKKLKADIFSVLSWQASLWYCQNVNLNQYCNKKHQTNLRNLLFTLISFYALDMKLNTNTNYLKENHHSVVTLNDYRTILTVLPLHTSSISHFKSKKNFALKDQRFFVVHNWMKNETFWSYLKVVESSVAHLSRHGLGHFDRQPRVESSLDR
jgi:hypothetical protein